jgi:predicted dehydrogenase
MSRLRVAVVGVGYIGQLHARVVAELAGATLAAVVDSSAATGQAVAQHHGCACFADVDAVLAANVADAYIVALPDTQHPDVVCKLLRAGKPVLVEKPMAHSLDAARAMAEAERAGGGRMMVAQILRFDPRYAQAAQAVRDGRIGEPLHASSGRLSLRDVGLRLNGTSSVRFYLGVHDIDALQWISGAEVTRVYARAVTKLMPSLGVAGEDAIFATCEMTNGMVGQLHFGWTLPSEAPTGIWARTEVIGTKGQIDLDVRDHGLRVLSGGAWKLPDGLHWPTVNGRITGDLVEEVRHFVQAVQDGTPFVISVAEAMRAVAVSDAIWRSVQSGQPEPVADWRG